MMDDVTIEKYVRVRLYLYKPQPDGSTDWLGHRCILKEYDLPREMYFAKHWVIRWRQSQLQCLTPKTTVQTEISFYDKKTGLDIGYQSAYSKLRSAKGMVTKITNAIAEYEAYQSTLLIWERDRDDKYQKTLAKLAYYKKELAERQAELDRLLKSKTNERNN